MAKKLRVGILFGGRSGEHEVSLLSAASVLNAIDRKKYDVVPIGITKQGRWLTAMNAEHLLTGGPANTSRGMLRAGDPDATATAAVIAHGGPPSTTLIPFESGVGESGVEESGIAVSRAGKSGKRESGKRESGKRGSVSLDGAALDVIFPVLHGTFGEDGTIQGLFELAGIAYVGSGVLGSATGMDKDVMKKLFAAAGLRGPKYTSLLRSEWKQSPRKVIARIEAALKYPLFVKPANSGSSVGISKAHDLKELGPALDLAAGFDRKIVVEQGVGGKKGKPRELEVAILGNDAPRASVVGEIVPGKEFYDYEAKYLSEGSIPIIPAKLTRSESRQIQQMAITAFKACDCSGLARVDFLKEPGDNGRIYLNEINTLPGFTAISMYPKLWEASGVPYRELITRLIELALERRVEKDETSYSLE